MFMRLLYSHYNPGDKQIATITLIFELNEIGKDYDAVNELVKKEAAKLGANPTFAIRTQKRLFLGRYSRETLENKGVNFQNGL